MKIEAPLTTVVAKLPDDATTATLQLQKLEVLVREHHEMLDRLLVERCLRYDQAIASIDAKATVALTEYAKRVEQRFADNKEAVGKSEIAQAAYNERSNEFRASLSDQAKLFLTRTEADTRLHALDEKMDARWGTLDNKIENNKKDVYDLREFRSSYTSATEDHKTAKQQTLQFVGVAIAVVFGGIGMIVGVVTLALRLAGK